VNPERRCRWLCGSLTTKDLGPARTQYRRTNCGLHTIRTDIIYKIKCGLLLTRLEEDSLSTRS